VQLLEYLLFPTRLLTSEDEYKWYWHQMIYFPEIINTISTTTTPSPTHSLVSSWAMHVNLLCACWHRETMRESSSLSSCRLLSSLVWAQLTPLVPALGIRPLLSQYGCPIHRVPTHSLTGIRNTYTDNFVVEAIIRVVFTLITFICTLHKLSM
jgi:hypothetical protein